MRVIAYKHLFKKQRLMVIITTTPTVFPCIMLTPFEP